MHRILAGLSLVVASLSATPGGAVREPPRPNLLVLVLDDVSNEDLAACATPAIDALARLGMNLENFYAMPVCSPTRYAMQLGRWPRRSDIGTGIDTYSPPSSRNPVPPRHLPSVARTLKAAGYRTAMVGKWHLGQPDLKGDLTGRFDLAPHLWGYDDWLAGAPENLNNGGGRGYVDWVRVDNGVTTRETQHATRVQAEAAGRWWADTSGPKLLWVNFSAPHGPFQPEDSTGATTQRAKFLRLIEECDVEIERLLRHVRLENTYVVLVTDNGTPNTVVEAGADSTRAKHSTYERGVNVPCWMAGPGIAPGSVLLEPVSCVDLPATLVELAGLSEPFQDGVSFADGLVNPVGWRNLERPWVFAEYYKQNLPGPSDLLLNDRMVRLGNWKMRRKIDSRTLLPVDFFYDLELDPTEAMPFNAQQAPAETVTALRAILEGLPGRGSDFEPRLMSSRQ